MIFRQLFDPKSATYTYILADETSKQGIIIDPVFEQVDRDLALLDELGITLLTSVDTHCHADHVTASWLLQHRTGCDIASAEVIGAQHTNKPLNHGDCITFGTEQLEVRATPGHTDGCLTYISHQHKLAFTGDALLIRGCGRCDFQQGDAKRLYQSINEQIFSLADDYTLYPGHDYSGRMMTTVGEEKQFNARIGGQADEQDFVGFMENMTLPHPKYIDVALPANLVSGKPETLPEQPTWAPLKLNYAGIYQVTASWVAANKDKVQVLDVREKQELNVAAVENAIHIPLAQLMENSGQLDTKLPIVVLCHSGKRSALAVQQLLKAGFEKVANIRGGIVDWQSQRLPVIKLA